MFGFVVDPNAALAAANACRSQADFMDDILRRIDRCTLDDFGDCRIGQSLTEKFGRKIGYDATGLGQPLKKAQQDLHDMATRFEAMAAAYLRTDQDNAGLLNGSGEAC